MLQVNYIKENKQEVIERLAIKNFTNTDIIEKVIFLDNNRKEIQKKLDDNLAESKSITKEIGILFKTGKAGETNQLKQKTGDLKKLSKELSEQLDKTSKELKYLLLEVPNIPHPAVPKGKTEEDNKIVFEEGELPKLDKVALPHWELAKKYDIINFELGSKVTGAGFPFYKGKGARLQRALINFFLDEALKEGYLEYQPPLLINEASGYGTGQLPDKDDQMYHIGIDNFYLIPTAEVPITNIYRDTILKYL
jgi:seryl-tRNA synthetase